MRAVHPIEPAEKSEGWAATPVLRRYCAPTTVQSLILGHQDLMRNYWACMETSWRTCYVQIDRFRPEDFCIQNLLLKEIKPLLVAFREMDFLENKRIEVSDLQ